MANASQKIREIRMLLDLYDEQVELETSMINDKIITSTEQLDELQKEFMSRCEKIINS